MTKSNVYIPNIKKDIPLDLLTMKWFIKEVITNLGLKNMYNSDRILIIGNFVEKQKKKKEPKNSNNKKQKTLGNASKV